MEKVFQEILNMDGVHGMVLLSDEGKVLFESLDKTRFVPEKSKSGWKLIMDSLNDFREMDLIFEEGRFYVLKTEAGIIIISMNLSVSVAMIKLNCDIIIPELKKALSGKGLKRFFRF
jgi:predicted transcriptional regulator